MHPKGKITILGAGVTGLAAGIKTGAPIYEANPYPGGICHSYLKNGYRFERGGGHWIFGSDRKTLNFIRSQTPLKSYQRKSAVFFPERDLFVPFPLQAHLSHLPKKIGRRALGEMEKTTTQELFTQATFADWLKITFGQTLFDLFFSPFHQLYTAGLHTKVAPQNHYKSPINKKTGYNQTFVYPKSGLGDLINKMAEKCQVICCKRAIKVNREKKEVIFQNGKKIKYQRLISTLPLNQIVQMTKIKLDEPPPLYNSLVVTNIAAKKGRKCPPHHWLYTPNTKSGFYRVGFYSNVDDSFLPSSRENKVSLYVDKTYLGGRKPTGKETRKLVKDIIKELKEWQFIDHVKAVDSTWIEVAYTWSLPNSKWREKALETLRKNEIYQIGRYGRWQFQGILESIKEGLTFSFSP